MTTGKLYPVAAIAYVLSEALGWGRQWVDTLNDFRQERSTGLKGHILLPVQHTRATSTASGRPLYELSDVRAFIVHVRHAYGQKRPFVPQIEVYEYDNTPGIPWSARPPATPIRP